MRGDAVVADAADPTGTGGDTKVAACRFQLFGTESPKCALTMAALRERLCRSGGATTGGAPEGGPPVAGVLGAVSSGCGPMGDAVLATVVHAEPLEPSGRKVQVLPRSRSIDLEREWICLDTSSDDGEEPGGDTAVSRPEATADAEVNVKHEARSPVHDSGLLSSSEGEGKHPYEGEQQALEEEQALEEVPRTKDTRTSLEKRLGFGRGPKKKKTGAKKSTAKRKVEPAADAITAKKNRPAAKARKCPHRVGDAVVVEYLARGTASQKYATGIVTGVVQASAKVWVRFAPERIQLGQLDMHVDTDIEFADRRFRDDLCKGPLVQIWAITMIWGQNRFPTYPESIY